MTEEIMKVWKVEDEDLARDLANNIEEFDSCKTYDEFYEATMNLRYNLREAGIDDEAYFKEWAGIE